MLISRLKRNSPLLGLVRLTARQVWLPLCPLRVALPVRLNVFSHSSNESPLEDSAPGSGAPLENTRYAIRQFTITDHSHTLFTAISDCCLFYSKKIVQCNY